MSKGSKPRPYNITQYGDNFDDIFSKETDDSIHKEQSEVMMGAIRQSNKQKISTETKSTYFAEECCEPHRVDCEDSE